MNSKVRSKGPVTEESARRWRVMPSVRPLFCLFLAASAVTFFACDGSQVSPAPDFADGGLLRVSEPLPQSAHVALEGHYRLGEGQSLLGDDVVLTAGLNSISLLSGHEAAVVALEAGCLSGDRLVLEGHYRYPRGREVGLVRLELVNKKAARELCLGQTTSEPISFSGNWGQGSESPTRELSLGEPSPLIPYRGRFFSVAHHGACEQSDTCAVSPNSLETILLAERYGANAMEVDVRVTKDGVPILFHDPLVNSSSTRGAFCHGAIPDQTLDQLKANCRLTYGEEIPTVEQALDVLLDQTLMDFVYLDMKVPEAVEPSFALALAINERAQKKGRSFRAVIALTKDSITSEWKDLVSKSPASPPCLVEYDPELVGELGCVAWGPTWTAGPRTADVKTVRASGARVIYWTLNDDNFIDEFLRSANPDGAITSRTGLLMYHYQKLGNVPPAVQGAPPPEEPGAGGAGGGPP